MLHGHFGGCKFGDGSKDCWCEIKRYWLVFSLSTLIFVMEVTGGIISNSLALLSDAGHVFADKTAILISIIIAYRIKKSPITENKIRTTGAYLNAGILGLLAVWIFWEAWERLWQPEEILSGTMFWVATVGAVLNYVQHRILEAAEHKDKHITHNWLSVHVLSDLGQSVAVIIASIVIYFTGKIIIDPILSMIVAIVMGFWTIKLLVSRKT